MADSVYGPVFGRSFSARAAEFGPIMEECDSMGPRAKFREVAENACFLGQFVQLAQAVAQLNLLKNCDSSLRSAASGIQCWALFRDLTGRPRFPPKKMGVPAWPSSFGSGRSWKLYVAHIEKASGRLDDVGVEGWPDRSLRAG